ncbi:MAG: hypothetical protein J7502_05015 [Flavisolibacter sp.]|nr:hypothetical protein [Flavisolibacter sp.]
MDFLWYWSFSADYKTIEVRHVVDEAEEKLKVNHKIILQELKEMQQEEIIKLLYENDISHDSPYTRIELTSKFFKTIKPKL